VEPRNISFASKTKEPQIRISTPAPAAALNSFTRYLEITFLDLSNKIKIVTIHKNLFSTMIF
jgi:hypothetical protein